MARLDDPDSWRIIGAPHGSRATSLAKPLVLPLQVQNFNTSVNANMARLMEAQSLASTEHFQHQEPIYWALCEMAASDISTDAIARVSTWLEGLERHSDEILFTSWSVILKGSEEHDYVDEQACAQLNEACSDVLVIEVRNRSVWQ
jgi:hypothetical protein